VLAGERSFLPLPPGKDADDDNNNNDQHPLPRFSHLPTWPTTRDTKYIRQGHGTSAIRLALIAHHVRLRQPRKQASKQPQGKKRKEKEITRGCWFLATTTPCWVGLSCVLRVEDIIVVSCCWSHEGQRATGVRSLLAPEHLPVGAVGARAHTKQGRFTEHAERYEL
jgi:hypothetical protein